MNESKVSTYLLIVSFILTSLLVTNADSTDSTYVVTGTTKDATAEVRIEHNQQSANRPAANVRLQAKAREESFFKLLHINQERRKCSLLKKKINQLKETRNRCL